MFYSGLLYHGYSKHPNTKGCVLITELFSDALLCFVSSITHNAVQLPADSDLALTSTPPQESDDAAVL